MTGERLGKDGRPRLYSITFSALHPLYVAKVERKGRSVAELDEVLRWLTGYTQAGLEAQKSKGNDLEGFFRNAPKLNPNRHLITGVICGIRVEDIEDPTTQEIRWMDKLVDELAKGKAMEKILRQA